MPLPKPRKNEERDNFIGRCMSDETMKSEFPSHTQRGAVCFTLYKQSRRKKRKADWDETKATMLPKGPFVVEE